MVRLFLAFEEILQKEDGVKLIFMERSLMFLGSSFYHCLYPLRT